MLYEKCKHIIKHLQEQDGDNIEEIIKLVDIIENLGWQRTINQRLNVSNNPAAKLGMFSGPL